VGNLLKDSERAINASVLVNVQCAYSHLPHSLWSSCEHLYYVRFLDPVSPEYNMAHILVNE